MNIIGRCYSATGVFGYEFFNENELFCAVSSLSMPSPPVLIHGCGCEWYSEFDTDIMIVSGLTRYVVDDKSKEEVFKIVYKDTNLYDIIFADIRITVHIENGSYIFLLDETEIVRLEKTEETYVKDSNVWQQYYSSDSFYLAVISGSMRTECILAMLSFPMLRFAF